MTETSTTPDARLPGVASTQYNTSALDFLEDTWEARDKFLSLCVPLQQYALKGNWTAAKCILDQDTRLRNAAIASGCPTVLHVAAKANQVHFVQELLRLLDEADVALQDMKGNTAFRFAVEAGNMRITKLMLQKNNFLPKIRGGVLGMTPIQFAAVQGRSEMAWYLYRETIDVFEEWDWKLLFFACLNTGLYDLALKMIKDRPALAFARDDENGETGLHLLAKMPLDCCCQRQKDQIPLLHPCMKQDVVLQLVRFIWNSILSNGNSKSEIKDIISQPSQLLFDAAKVGNSDFLSVLISSYPDLIWEVDSRNRSIIHIAVLHRHARIYSLIHEIGCERDDLVTSVDNDNNTLLHLAAKLAPPDQLDLVSGAALQMSLELVCFKEIEKIMPRSFIKMKNSEGLTARQLFTREHVELRRKAEAWMKRTAESCMIISTVIAAGVLSASFSLAGSTNDATGRPNYLEKPSLQIFAISNATAFISSLISIITFLAILISRYAEYDFYKSLPMKLLFGLITIFISITSIMIAFGSAFFITYYHGMKWVPIFISILSCLPVFVFILLQLRLWSDIIYYTYYCWSLFQPNKNMLH